MSAPANPTLSSLVSEALAKSGESSPSTDLTTRAQNSWMEEIKNDIWHRAKKLRSLHITAHGILPRGQARYSFPSDYSSDLELTLLSGGTSGIAQNGTASSLTLSSSDPSSEDQIIGKELLITSGAGVGSLGQIVGYSQSTKIASIAQTFKETPSAGSTYLIIDSEKEVNQKPINQYNYFHQVGTGVPLYFFPIGDEDFGEFILNVAPEQQFGARLRYYSNIMRLDILGTLMSTLYLNWRNLFESGLIYKKFQDADDDRQDTQYQKYQRELNSLITRETYGVDISNLTDRVVDFR